ncbi:MULTISPECIES: 3-oxoacyl-ACP synthase III family protein [unclassified Roseofilum]|uniref:3-oxoacyl-ACP synthase III family protein n=1 Tax=unclassified Roseofilum TaxID=2620099 RepID=UPI001B2C773A|nr:MULTISPECIES: 3-oxoacyl-[acyl-carrier-protein] synthase III C-terminal domain-containing protein [unclassified Roseofilum]MBP0009376.1 3-oxoacyl-ACP synthase [Roseofilum sp. Belize Diploria]MBP0033851.1 3-oxoacyl-ACP synthase [Roseofilum sp. Belize BBD 4]
MLKSVGIRSIAVKFPSVIRTNNYFLEQYPELVSSAEERSLARAFSADRSTALSNDFDRAMAPYLSDPFRGAVERRVLGEGESPLTLEYGAAVDALEAAKLQPEEIDLMIVASFMSENYVPPGNAAYLHKQLGLHCPAWNLESACSSGLIILETACAMVNSGNYKNVLVVVSNTYSRVSPEDDTVSWFIGDGAGAMVVSHLKENQGMLGIKVVDTARTCGAFQHLITVDNEGNPKVIMKTNKEGGKKIRETGTEYILSCCRGAAVAAGVSLQAINFFAFNTPLAWYADLCIRTLGLDPDRTINLYPQYANIGAVLPIANLYHGAQTGKIKENDLVLIYTIGSASTAGAMVMRWGDVALGAAPVPSPSSVQKVAVAV